jgi:hypothetical protein
MKKFILLLLVALVALPAFAQTATPTPTRTPTPAVIYGLVGQTGRAIVVTRQWQLGTTCVGKNGEFLTRTGTTGGLQVCANGVWFTVPIYSPTPTPTPTPTATPTATPTP